MFSANLRPLIALLGAGALSFPAAAGAAPTASRVRLTATSTSAMSITGNLRLLGRGGIVRTIVFANGKSLTLAGGTDGVYRVTPPANPILLRGNRLCGDGPATRIALTFGIHGAASMSVYRGAAMTDATLCGIFNYST